MGICLFIHTLWRLNTLCNLCIYIWRNIASASDSIARKVLLTCRTGRNRELLLQALDVRATSRNLEEGISSLKQTQGLPSGFDVYFVPSLFFLSSSASWRCQVSGGHHDAGLHGLELKLYCIAHCKMLMQSSRTSSRIYSRTWAIGNGPGSRGCYPELS